jgi:hypothetical protein
VVTVPAVDAAQSQPLSPFVIPVLSFVLGIVGTLLIESMLRPWVERRRRRVERWENELEQLRELLEVRLPSLAEKLNLELQFMSWPTEIKNRGKLPAQERALLDRWAREIRETADRLYEAWREPAQTAEVLARRVARFSRSDSVTPEELTGWLYSRLYFAQMAQVWNEEVPSGDYRQEEKKLRGRLLAWAEKQLREGKPARRGRRWPQFPRGRAGGLLVVVSFVLLVVILNVALGP